MWFLFSCNYIKYSGAMFGGLSWEGAWKRMVGGGDPLIDDCNTLLIILVWNGCLCA
jgi:hypothetical protein